MGLRHYWSLPSPSIVGFIGLGPFSVNFKQWRFFMENDENVSRSEMKRRAKDIEDLAQEIVGLSATDLGWLPVEDALRKEIRAAGAMKGGARKRQIKFIAKELRNIDVEPLLAVLASRKGSLLKQRQEFQGLERLRDTILTEAIGAQREAEKTGEPLALDWQGETVARALAKLPGLDADHVNRAAARYARTRKPVYSREIFRLLKAAEERLKFQTVRDKAEEQKES